MRIADVYLAAIVIRCLKPDQPLVGLAMEAFGEDACSVRAYDTSPLRRGLPLLRPAQRCKRAAIISNGEAGKPPLLQRDILM